ncbi:hypothetical protein LCGC14_0347300 [marine sediment metagenome]|uniref:Radical SAM core domain-containing protein n=1 Tax=marine sediment metagenome TaxID=412755 RepID=A0A0F9WJM0_9ZZZZ
MSPSQPFKWKIVPLSKFQLLDIREEDILNEGHFRKCDTYRGGGGYDQFPAIFMKRTGLGSPNKQFVVQTYGCNLDCQYCYVTRSGVWGQYVEYDTYDLVASFRASEQEVFHLMGGAPAFYLDHWPELLDALSLFSDIPFHSDFLLTEHIYDIEVLRDIARPNCLYAVSIKGTSKQNYETNTRRPYMEYSETMILGQLERLKIAGVNFYITFTNPDEQLEEYKAMMAYSLGEDIFEDSFVIGLKDYKAVEFVDIDPRFPEVKA